ncbi:uncharacterized protein LOC125235445 [Leguminivora glycinivorella]|uniref:uncharacterized protein LOC125235445 n=1 Tax=Leguminivora glycinivorella TaxID=1035111 RepID=UPI00200BE4EA|nr:uncharacterized protein LOC125235445 [Leguminivora glycinivorella]
MRSTYNNNSSKVARFISYNCKSVKRSVDCIRNLCTKADIIALQETWLYPCDLHFLGTIHPDFAYIGTSAVDTSTGPMRGRPHGGVALLWRKGAFQSVSVISCDSVRLAAIRITTGWNRYVKEVHERARLSFQEWSLHGKPSQGPLYTKMVESRRDFKLKLKWCQNHQEQIKMDMLSTHHLNKNFSKFWKCTKKLSPEPGRSVNVDGLNEPSAIANHFKNIFRVKPPQRHAKGRPEKYKKC